MRWNDPKLAISWPLDGIGEPLVSGKDASESVLDEAERQQHTRSKYPHMETPRTLQNIVQRFSNASKSLESSGALCVSNLLRDPGVSLRQAIAQRRTRLPAELFAD